MFANGPGDLDSILVHVIPKTLKMYVIPPCLTLSNIRNVSWIKWSNLGKGVAPSPTLQCCSYRKGSLLDAFDYGRQLYISIYCYPQTYCFVVSQLFSVARHVGRLKMGSKPAQLYVRLCIRPLSQPTNHVSSGIIVVF